MLFSSVVRYRHLSRIKPSQPLYRISKTNKNTTKSAGFLHLAAFLEVSGLRSVPLAKFQSYWQWWWIYQLELWFLLTCTQ